jgi:hypothetical protein
VIATPVSFFNQHLYESDYEQHISHWTKKDFMQIGRVCDQKIDSGAIFIVSKNKIDIRGFGNSFIKKIRRIGRAIKNEI